LADLVGLVGFADLTGLADLTGFADLTGLAGCLAGLARLAGLAGLTGLVGLAAVTRFGGALERVFFVGRRGGWLRRGMGMGYFKEGRRPVAE
jgi:hypothetical protein